MFNTIWGYIAWAVLTAILTAGATALLDGIRAKRKGGRDE